MNQHPVPQNVTQYQFRLVGDMTLKQFLELAGGLVLAILFYSSNLIFIFKWPLILLSVFFGIALAFFPIEDRPLDQWIINFINSIYKPTRFIWKKTNKVPNIFTFTAHPIAPTNTITKTIKAPTQRSATTPVEDYSESESLQLKSLNSLFGSVPPTSSTPQNTASKAQETILYDKPSVNVRKLNPASNLDPSLLKNQRPPSTTLTIPKSNSPVIPKVSQPSSALPSPTVPDNLIYQGGLASRPAAPTTPSKTTLSPIQLPVAPRLPNLIVGVTTGSNGKLIEGAIVQVIDQSGVPARAMKTNALGQFATSTPLTPGTYRLEVEADGHTFTPQQLIINNSIIQPFEIKANTNS